MDDLCDFAYTDIIVGRFALIPFVLHRMSGNACTLIFVSTTLMLSPYNIESIAGMT